MSRADEYAIVLQSRRARPVGFKRVWSACPMVMVALVMGATAWASAPRKPWNAPPSASQKTNPTPSDAASIARGKQLYTQNCFACHGTLGKGDGPAGSGLNPHPGDLSDSAAMWGQSDGALFWKISNGRSPMPGFADTFSEQDRWRLIDYIRTLSPRPKLSRPKFEVSDSVREALSAVVRPYLGAQAALAGDDLAKAISAVGSVKAAVDGLGQFDVTEFGASAGAAWERDVRDLTEKAAALASSTSDLADLRASFGAFSGSLVVMLEDFGHALPEPISIFDVKVKRAQMTWAQRGAKPVNPYGKKAARKKPTLRERLAPDQQS